MEDPFLQKIFILHCIQKSCGGVAGMKVSWNGLCYSLVYIFNENLSNLSMFSIQDIVFYIINNMYSRILRYKPFFDPYKKVKFFQFYGHRSNSLWKVFIKVLSFNQITLQFLSTKPDRKIINYFNKIQKSTLCEKINLAKVVLNDSSYWT